MSVLWCERCHALPCVVRACTYVCVYARTLAIFTRTPPTHTGTLDTDSDVDQPADLGVWWGDSLPSGKMRSSLSDSDSF